jgi:hypothetical protein
MQWPEEWLPYLLVEFWQEPQGDFQGREAEFHQQVQALADVCGDYGIQTGVHLETWNLHPTQPHGGTPGCRALLEPVLDMIDWVTWSIFEFNLKPTVVDYVAWLATFMADYDKPWGATAIGVSVPTATATEEQRILRVHLLDTVYDALVPTDATICGHYSVPVPPDPTRSCYDDKVAAYLKDLLKT